MSQSFDDRFERLLHGHDIGIISTHEFTHDLFLCAAYAQFFSCLTAIPDSVMPELHRLAKDGPAHPEDVPRSTTAIFTSPEEFDAWDCQMRQEYYWAARNIREHFFPNLPTPKFEPHISIGTVEDLCISDGDLVFLGKFQSRLIRANPTTLKQAGHHTPIWFLGDTNVKRLNDPPTSDPFCRRYGRPGMIVDPKSEMPEVIQPGAEIWVDRTAVQELPQQPECD